MEIKTLREAIEIRLTNEIEKILNKEEITYEEFKILKNYAYDLRMQEGMKNLTMMSGLGICED